MTGGDLFTTTLPKEAKIILRLDNVEIVVSNWHIAQRWYVEKLGLEPMDIVDNEYDQWCRLRFPDGSNPLALWGEPNAKQARRHRCLDAVSRKTRQWLCDKLCANRYIPIILVADLPSTVMELKERGVEFIENIGDEQGYRITTFMDCEGNKLQLKEYRKN